jgi:hypothetical protein
MQIGWNEVSREQTFHVGVLGIRTKYFEIVDETLCAMIASQYWYVITSFLNSLSQSPTDWAKELGRS